MKMKESEALHHKKITQLHWTNSLLIKPHVTSSNFDFQRNRHKKRVIAGIIKNKRKKDQRWRESKGKRIAERCSAYSGGLKLHPLYKGEAFVEDIHPTSPKWVDLSHVISPLGLPFDCASLYFQLWIPVFSSSQRRAEIPCCAIARGHERFSPAIFTLDPPRDTEVSKDLSILYRLADSAGSRRLIPRTNGSRTFSVGNFDVGCEMKSIWDPTL